LKVYVAAAFQEYPRARRVMDALRAQGHTIVHDWTAGAETQVPEEQLSEDEREAKVIACTDAVAACEWFLLLVPERREIGCGCWVELGMAVHRYLIEDDASPPIGIFVAGKDWRRTLFTDWWHKVDTDEEVIELLRPAS
jgi:hypothetical protein